MLVAKTRLNDRDDRAIGNGSHLCTKRLKRRQKWVTVPQTPCAGRRYPDDAPPTLDATLRIVHGAETIADSTAGEPAMCDRFESWIRTRYPPSAPA
jgi:hypothetical protein